MTHQLVILTGASRGMGAAIATQLLARPGTSMLCIARNANPALDAVADQSGTLCTQWTADLAQPVAVAARLQDWLGALDGTRFTGASLVNNAAMLTTIGPIERCGADELSMALRVGLEAPLLLTAAFLRATSAWPGARRVLNISSGLGRHAMAGQATYCAAKAGLDHLSRALALDQAEQHHGARIVSLSPGVIDTDMQTHLRGADAAGFPDRSMFLQLKASGQLATTEVAAARVIAYLDRPDFGDSPVADVRSA